MFNGDMSNTFIQILSNISINKYFFNVKQIKQPTKQIFVVFVYRRTITYQ